MRLKTVIVKLVSQVHFGEDCVVVAPKHVGLANLTITVLSVSKVVFTFT
jgi:hypothetical protein